MGADYDPKQSGSPRSYLALVMEALSKEQGDAIVAGIRRVTGRDFFGWPAANRQWGAASRTRWLERRRRDRWLAVECRRCRTRGRGHP